MTRRGKNEKTLYDKTLVGRARSMGRRSKRAASALIAFGLLAGGTAVGVAPAHAADPTPTPTPTTAGGTQYGGFTTTATATPLKLEIFEPAIPIPTDPQAELDFSYTRVLGGSGPATTARSSALWPGAALGEGLKTFGQQLGLPGALTDGGYPVQANAGFPGDVTQQSQEFVPGMIGRVDAGDKRTIAKVSYTSSDVSDGDAGDGKKASTNPLDALTQLIGAKSGTPSPLGTLGLLIDFDGMTSVSSTDYDGSTVIATATSRIGELKLLGGLISLNGVNVVTKVTSSLDGGAKTAQTVDVGGVTIAGQKFSYGPDGLTAAGKNTPIPGIPSSVAGLLKMLGVAIEVPKPDVTAKDSSGSISAEALRITLDTKPLRSKLPSLPLDGLINGLPDLPGQASLLKGLLLSLNTIAPKVVLHLGSAQVSAETVSVADLGGGAGTTAPGSAAPGLSGGAPSVGDTPQVAPDDLKTTPTTTPVAKGLPPLRSLPTLLLLAGLALAAAAAWYLRYAGLMLFGGSAACAFGLKVGIPDLRKA